jgi:predicted DNA-binding transcriptional regulator AlpA
VYSTDLFQQDGIDMTEQSPFMFRDEVDAIHPVHDRTRKRAETAGLFPRRIQLGPHKPGWWRSEVQAWQANPRAWAMPEHAA